jgi:hypothetical protein
MRQPRGFHMGLNSSIKQFLERKRWNDLKHYLLSRLLKFWIKSKWHEAMVETKIDVQSGFWRT